MSVVDQGGTFASDIFNLLTDDTTRMDDSVVKNMDDLMFYADSLSDLEKKIKEFLVFCKEKNLRLKSSKFVIQYITKEWV